MREALVRSSPSGGHRKSDQTHYVATSNFTRMRRDTTQPYVNWTIRITRESKEGFTHLFPMRGAQTWFVVESIKRILKDVEHNKALRTHCNRQIEEMLYNGPGVVEEFSIRMPTELYEAFNDTFPQWGAATWLVRSLVDAVVEVMDRSSLSDYLDQTVQRVLTP